MKAFGINGSSTSHGGSIVATQQTTSEENIAFLRAGDGFYCPKCKCWSTLTPSNSLIIIHGKPVAFVGDKFTCGATLLPKQNLVVGQAQGKIDSLFSEKDTFKSSINSVSPKNKKIIEIFWSYGSDYIRLNEYSRHYVDLNLHVKTENYNIGENVVVTLKASHGEISDNQSEIKVSGKVNSSGEVIIKNPFKSKIINI